jgi:phosphoglycolate phosphatase
MISNQAEKTVFPSRFSGIRLVVFDLDGTLVDAFADIAEAANYILHSEGRPEISVEEVKLHVGQGARVLVAGVLGTDDAETIERNYQRMVEYYQHHSSNKTTLYEDVEETLEALHRFGIRTAVASNKPDVVTQRLLERLEIKDLFDFIAGESSRFPRKPAPDVLRHIMERAEVRPEETVVVGDSWVDIEFARSAGAGVVAVTYGQSTFEQLNEFKPDAILHSLKELPALFQA